MLLDTESVVVILGSFSTSETGGTEMFRAGDLLFLGGLPTAEVALRYARTFFLGAEMTSMRLAAVSLEKAFSAVVSVGRKDRTVFLLFGTIGSSENGGGASETSTRGSTRTGATIA